MTAGLKRGDESVTARFKLEKALAAGMEWATFYLPLRKGAQFFLFEKRASADPEK
jgi:hypothetical protein